jgi:uncharacterized membrane protein YdjX (TVP38/TMEM64 family)
MGRRAESAYNHSVSEPAAAGVFGVEKVLREKRRARLRLALLGAITLTLFITGVVVVGDGLTADGLREEVRKAGAFGFVLFIGIFIIGQMLHLPGLIFIGAGAFAFGAPVGGPLSLLAASIAVSVNFAFVRTVGGQPLVAIERPLFKRVMAMLDDHPLRTVVVLRLIFFTSPAISAALALTGVRFRDHLTGSIVGMAAPVVGAAFLADVIFK